MLIKSVFECIKQKAHFKARETVSFNSLPMVVSSLIAWLKSYAHHWL